MANGVRKFRPGEEKQPPPVSEETGGGAGFAGEWPPDDGADALALIPLGRRDRTYYLMSLSGEKFEMSGKELMSAQGIAELFDGNIAWLRRWSAFAGEKQGSIAWATVGRWLMRLCARAGLWDPATPIRGPGVWRGDDGGLVVHAGDAVLIDGDWLSAGRKIGRALYPAAPTLPHPAERPGTARDGAALLAAAQLWAYEDAEIGADLIVGMIGAAMLGGAPQHRAHMLITGRYGSGKSWLMDLILAALGAGAQVPQNDMSAAYLYQAFTGEARALVLDESEEEGRSGRVARIIQLLRAMATGRGAEIGRGSAGGKSVSYHVTGAAVMGATLAPQLKPQDRSRITHLRLAPLPTGQEATGAAARAEAAIAEVARRSAALRSRAITGWARFNDTAEAYRARFLEVGLSPRDANQASTLLAGRDLLTRDNVPLADEVDLEVERFLPLVQWAAENADEGEGQRALSNLLTSPVDLWRGGERLTVAEMIWRAFFAAERTDYRAKLPSLGLRAEYNAEAVEPGTPPVREIWVANDNVFLKRLFQGTHWEGRWAEALRDLGREHEDPRWRVRPGERPQRFAGVQCRYTVVPEGWLPQEGDGPPRAGTSDDPDPGDVTL